MNTHLHRCRGVTLVELLVALGIVATLTAIAWPGYGAALHRAHRHDARSALLRIQQMQESHYATHLRYADRLGAAADEESLGMTSTSPGGHYALSVTATDDGQGFTALARALPGSRQVRDRPCQQLLVDHTGRRRTADAEGRWSTDDPNRCWG